MRDKRTLGTFRERNESAAIQRLCKVFTCNQMTPIGNMGTWALRSTYDFQVQRLGVVARIDLAWYCAVHEGVSSIESHLLTHALISRRAVAPWALAAHELASVVDLQTCHVHKTRIAWMTPALLERAASL